MFEGQSHRLPAQPAIKQHTTKPRAINVAVVLATLLVLHADTANAQNWGRALGVGFGVLGAGILLHGLLNQPRGYRLAEPRHARRQREEAVRPVHREEPRAVRQAARPAGPTPVLRVERTGAAGAPHEPAVVPEGQAPSVQPNAPTVTTAVAPAGERPAIAPIRVGPSESSAEQAPAKPAEVGKSPQSPLAAEPPVGSLASKSPGPSPAASAPQQPALNAPPPAAGPFTAGPGGGSLF